MELLLNEFELIRGFAKSIICDNCGRRAFISAIPEISDVYIGLSKGEKRNNVDINIKI